MSQNRTVTIGTSATQIVAPMYPHQRGNVLIQVEEVSDDDGAVYLGIGDPNVTTTTGIFLKKDHSINLSNGMLDKPASEGVWALVPEGTAKVRVTETA